jgi:hypothetical protein
MLNHAALDGKDVDAMEGERSDDRLVHSIKIAADFESTLTFLNVPNQI